MRADRTDGETRKTQASWYAATLSLLVLTALGTIVWGNRGVSIASLGIAWVVLVASFSIFATKYLEQRANGAPGRERPEGGNGSVEEAPGAMGDNLPDGYFLVHGFDSVMGKIDRILVCPKGIFTLETDGCEGEVTFDGEKLLRNGRPFEKDILKQAWAQCFLARNLLGGWGLTSPLPEPVIFFRNAAVRIPGKAKGIEIAGNGQFPQNLVRLPNRLSAAEAGKIYSRIQAASLL